MITALITFLSSSAGGALLGFVLDFFDRRHENQLAVEDRRLKSRLAELGAIAEHTKQLDTNTPGTLKEETKTLQLGTWKYERKHWKLYKTNVYSPRARIVAFCLGMLACTYCFTLAVFTLEPNWEIWTLHPDPDPVDFDFLFIHVSWPRSSIFTLTSGGIAYIMAHPLVFILSTSIVGTTRKLGK